MCPCEVGLHCSIRTQADENLHHREPYYHCAREKGIKGTGHCPLRTAGSNIHWCSCYRETYGDSSKELKIELPYDPEIPLLGLYQKKIKTQIRRDICVPVFALLFATAQIWKEFKCPSIMDGWWRCGTHSVEQYSATKKMKSCHLQQRGWT